MAISTAGLKMQSAQRENMFSFLLRGQKRKIYSVMAVRIIAVYIKTRF